MATSGRQQLLFQDVFRGRDKGFKGYLTAEELWNLYGELRTGELSLQQVVASIEFICAGNTCDPDEFLDCLKEMDRRYALVQDLRWEFCLLANNGETISESQALFLMKAVHNELFSQKRWDQFVSKRIRTGGWGVTFDEIEVELCNIPDREFIEWEKEMERKAREEAAQREEEERKRKEREEEEKRRKEEERLRKLKEEQIRKEEEAKKRRQKEELEQRKQEDAARREQEERERKEAEERRAKEEEEMKQKQQKEEEERLRQEEEAHLADEQAAEDERRKAEEEQKQREEEEREKLEQQKRLEEQRKLEEQQRKEEEEARHAESLAEAAAKAEAAAAEEAARAAEEAAKAETEEEKRKAKEVELAAKKRLRVEKAKKINHNLEGAIKSRKIERLEPAIKEAEKGKEDQLEELNEKKLEEAKKLLEQLQTAKNLNNAVGRRKIDALEDAMKAVKRAGYEVELAREMTEASVLLTKLKRLEQLKKEVLNLDGRTIAELKSYSNPPKAVHDVMIATFLVLGHPEKVTRKWPSVQALIGKTGKESLKRRVGECEADKIKPEVCSRIEDLLKQYDLQRVTEVSRGAAVFYVWVLGMVEETKAITT